MSAGTKIFLAVVVLFVGALVVYYGVLSPSTEPKIQKDADDGEQSQTFRNALPDDSSADTTDRQQWLREQMNDSESAGPPEPVQGNLARPEERPAFGTRSPMVDSSGAPPRSDGGKELPLSASMGPPIPDGHDAGAAVQSSPPPRKPQAGRPALTNTTMMSDGERAAADSGAPKRIAYYLYTVHSGDTLAWIAEDWFGDASKWQLITEMNPGLDPNHLRVGQKIKLPPRDSARATPTPAASAGTDRNTYVVRSGDTLSVIAQKMYGKASAWERIYDANRSAIGGNPDALKVGMKLTIPRR